MFATRSDGGDTGETSGDGGLAAAVVAPADDGAVVPEREAVVVTRCDSGDAGKAGGDGGLAFAVVAPAQQNRDSDSGVVAFRGMPVCDVQETGAASVCGVVHVGRGGRIEVHLLKKIRWPVSLNRSAADQSNSDKVSAARAAAEQATRECQSCVPSRILPEEGTEN